MLPPIEASPPTLARGNNPTRRQKPSVEPQSRIMNVFGLLQFLLQLVVERNELENVFEVTVDTTGEVKTTTAVVNDTERHAGSSAAAPAQSNQNELASSDPDPSGNPNLNGSQSLTSTTKDAKDEDASATVLEKDTARITQTEALLTNQKKLENDTVRLKYNPTMTATSNNANITTNGGESAGKRKPTADTVQTQSKVAVVLKKATTPTQTANTKTNPINAEEAARLLATAGAVAKHVGRGSNVSSLMPTTEPSADPTASSSTKPTATPTVKPTAVVVKNQYNDLKTVAVQTHQSPTPTSTFGQFSQPFMTPERLITVLMCMLEMGAGKDIEMGSRSGSGSGSGAGSGAGGGGGAAIGLRNQALKAGTLMTLNGGSMQIKIQVTTVLDEDSDSDDPSSELDEQPVSTCTSITKTVTIKSSNGAAKTKARAKSKKAKRRCQQKRLCKCKGHMETGVDFARLAELEGLTTEQLLQNIEAKWNMMLKGMGAKFTPCRCPGVFAALVACCARIKRYRQKGVMGTPPPPIEGINKIAKAAGLGDRRKVITAQILNSSGYQRSKRDGKEKWKFTGRMVSQRKPSLR